MLIDISANAKYEVKDLNEAIDRLIISLRALRNDEEVTKLPQERFSFNLSVDYYEED